MKEFRPRTLAAAAPAPVLVVATALAAAVACSDSATQPRVTQVPHGAVVLNGFGQQGVTLVPDSGTATARIDFGAQFDGGGVSVLHDTALSTSSKAAGDQLYVADLNALTLVRVQMPHASNPAGAEFVGGAGGANVAVALRDSGAIALVRFTGGATSSTTLIRNVGRCPTDVAVQGGAFWVLDANLNCDAGGYTSQGDSRLIRVNADGTGARDTLVLTGVRNASKIVVIGDLAYVASSGVADYSNYPTVSFVQPGAVTEVDLAAQSVRRTATLPGGTNGAGMQLGADGVFYVTAYTSTSFATQDVFAFDQSLSPTGTRAAGKQSLALTLADGTAPVCAAATADLNGRIYCATNSPTSLATTTVYVFDRSGTLRRSVAAGQGAVDIAVR